MSTNIKLAAAKVANRIRKSKGLPELSLSFWDEDLHPRGQHGRFAPKGGRESFVGNISESGGRSYHQQSSSRYGEYNGETYDREEIQREIARRYYQPPSNSKSNLREFLEGVGLIVGGQFAPAIAGTAAGLAGGGMILTGGAALLGTLAGFSFLAYGSYKIAKALIKGTAYAIGKWGTKATYATGAAVSAPFEEFGRGVSEA